MKKNIIKKFIILVFILVFTSTVFAEELIPKIPNEETSEIIPEPIIPTNTIFIRSGENVIYDSIVNLPESGIVYVLDSSGNNHEINSQSVLGLLYTLSQEIDAPFVISNLQYYSSMNALYLKCITPKDGVELCDNWQYVVGGITPWTGIDQTFLSGGEQVGLYFGTPHKLTLDKNEVLEGEPVVVNSLKYNYIDDTWEILSGVSISVTIPKDGDPWNPTIISETSVDENGIISIPLNTEGSYTFGIKEDYSFPSYQVVVKKADNGGGSSGGGDSDVTNFSIENAINFLLTNQDEDGSFGNPLYTDWVAIGISQAGNSANLIKNTISNYLKNEEFKSSIITDNERHAMALMSLGINPYTGTNIDYIKKITSSYDGTQIGEKDLINDDIFGLIVLFHAGYKKSDEIISIVTSYIISKQDPDGSWGSVDMTSAAIQALSNFKSLSGVKSSIEKGELYLKNNQNEDGGFGNSFSTSWAVQALSLNSSYEEEVNKAIIYLKEKQQSDGGLDINDDISSRVWSTSYAIPAILKLSWNDIWEFFNKEELNVSIQDDVVEKLPAAQDLQIPTLKIEEKKIEIPEEPIKVIKLKKEIKNNNEDIIVTESLDNNLLSASVIGLIQNNATPPSVMNRIFNIIKVPFVWLWIVLGF